MLASALGERHLRSEAILVNAGQVSEFVPTLVGAR